MSRNESKLARANVVAAFDSQDAADEAVLELRSAGFPDRRIGYFSAGPRGRMEDGLASHHRFAAAVIWGVVGGAIGTGVVLLLHRLGAAGPDPVGMAATIGVCGALGLGVLGGIAGLPARDADAPATGDEPFLLSVEAGGAAGRVWEIVRRRGGHEPHAHAPPAVTPGHLPM